MKWARLVELVSEWTKVHVIPALLKALGLAGGFWTFAVSTFLVLVWEKLSKKAASAARLEDQENIDEQNIEQYKNDKKEGAPVETLIEDETNLLNGSRPK